MHKSSLTQSLDYSNPAIQALLTERSNLTNENASLRGDLQHLKDSVNYLEEMLRRALRQRFGSSSESSRHPASKAMFNESEFEASQDEDNSTLPTPERKNKKRGMPVRRPLPKNLPREIKIIDLTPEEKKCALSGAPLIQIGEEVTEQLDIEPATMKVIETHRLKYVCHCAQCQSLEGEPTTAGSPVKVIQCAPLPAQAIPKSMATPGLLAMIATNKFEMALPLYRQETFFKRLNVDLKRSTMGSWMVRCGKLVQPLINLMWDELKTSPLIFGDETPLQVHKGTGRPSTAKSYMWAFMRGGRTGPPIALYELGPSRSHKVALRYLEDYHGYLHTDGYEAYATLASKCPGITLVGDWVHVRRRFDEAIKAQPDPQSSKIKAKVPFVLINELFAIEREIADQSDDERIRIRQSRSQPLVDAIKVWADENRNLIPPKSLTGTAITYFLGQWPKLSYFLKDARVGLDTNAIENKIRPFVIGRRNWLFSDTLAGAEASAALYSLIVTAKCNNLNAFDYLKAVFTELPKTTTVEQIEALLPWRWTPPTPLLSKN